MAEAENLEILIDVIDNFSDELFRLILLLENVDALADMLDPIRIDVDVTGEGELAALVGELSALEAMDLSGMGDIVVGKKSVRRGGGGGTASISGRSLDRLAQTMTESLAETFDGMSMEAEDTTDSMANMARATNEATDSVDLFDLRMSDMHNALAKLVPLILVLIGALPALIGGLVALGAAAISAASALVALGGLGALGFAAAQAGRGNLMEGFSEIMSDLRESFLDAFMPIAQRLVPLFEDALDGFDRLLANIASRGDILVNLSDQARAFGGFLMDFIPGALAAMGKMTAAFDGFFSIIAEGMRDMDLLRGLTGFFAEIQPEFTKFFALLMPLIPAIGNLSIGFLKVTNAILTLIYPFARLAEMFPMVTAFIGGFIATLMAAITALGIFSGMQALTATILTSSLLPSIQAAAFSLISTYAPGMQYATANTLAFAVALTFATAGIAALLAGVTWLGSEFMSLGADIDTATESLKNFDSVASGMSGPNPYAHPDVEEGSVSGSSRFARGGGGVNVTIQGNADEDTVRNQVHNAQYRQERSRRKL